MSLSFSTIVVFLATAAVAGQVPRPGPPAPPGSPVAPATPAGAGIIRGVVTAGDTAKPLRGVDVRIEGGALPRFEPRWARTDAQGRYEVTGLGAGRYNLSASKVGYITLEYGQRRPVESGRPVEVSESTALKADFALPRAGVIVARITDRFGDPVRGVVGAGLSVSIQRRRASPAGSQRGSSRGTFGHRRSRRAANPWIATGRVHRRGVASAWGCLGARRRRHLPPRDGAC